MRNRLTGLENNRKKQTETKEIFEGENNSLKLQQINQTFPKPKPILPLNFVMFINPPWTAELESFELPLVLYCKYHEDNIVSILMDYQNEKMILPCLLELYTSTWFISLVCVLSM